MRTPIQLDTGAPPGDIRSGPLSAVKLVMRSYLQRWRGANGIPVILFGSIFLYGVVYRARLYFRFAEDQLTRQADFVALLQYPAYELLFAALVCLVSWPIAILFRRRGATGRQRWIALWALQPLLGLCVLLYTTHYSLVFSVRSGLTWDMIVETFAAGAAFAMAGELTLSDQIHLVLLFVLFWGFVFWPPRLIPARNVGLLIAALPLLVFAAFQKAPGPEISDEIRLNPILYTARDIARSIMAKGTGPSVATKTGQLESVAFVADEFVTQPPEKERPGRRGHRWNVVVVVLESTGGDYVFSTKYGNQVPMRFLKRLSEKSLLMTNHVSPANTTPRGSFSVFSGLFPDPQLKMFVTRKDVRIPSMLQFLGGGYDAFLVYNGSLDWFFPHGFFRNNDFEMFGMENVHRKRWRHGPTNGRNEVQMVDFFLERLKRAKGPFFAVYHSYAAHWPYIDYGPEFDVFGSNRPKIHDWVYRYYNNLRLMDMQIERIYHTLEKMGRLSDTVIVVTGDHGQAFGKHPGNWIHSRASFMENYRVPLVIFSPGLRQPLVINKRTQHADILPTVLSLMGVSYNPRLVQGENILKKAFRRRYDFMYGNERTLSTIDRQTDIKLQLGLKNGQCWVYDLRRDPEETKRLSCDRHGKQRAATLSYERFQRRILEDYNRALIAGSPFFGQNHPYQRSPRPGAR